MQNKNIIFLDTNSKNNKQNKSYIFLNPLEEIIAFNENEIFSAFSKINELAKKYWIVGYIRYEAGYFFTNIEKLQNSKNIKKPLIWFGVYDSPIEIDNNIKIEKFFYKPFINILENISFDTYDKKISEIKKEIKKGNTYQVNFTIENFLKTYCSEENLYFSLREQQKTSYSAFIRNDFETILSFSPELFFEINENKIFVKPMKGTVKRGKTQKEDEFLVSKILLNEKNKAENMMIVDLLRNDLGKIAKNGTVQVEKKLEVETHKTLHQITSTVSAELKNLDYFEIFKALFPCGSVTGAPKIETMKIINRLEKNDRDIYCGAIGYISPKKNKAVFSVPIRILQKVEKSNWIYKVGGGITWDSTSKDEWNEIQTKTLFLKKNSINDFSLIETMLLENNKILFLDEHLNRLKNSANFFEFKLDIEKIKLELLNIKTKYIKTMIRFILKKDGNYSFEKLEIYNDEKNEKKVKLSNIILDKQNIFLNHKTTYRPWYEKTSQKIKNNEIWDEIFINQDNEICEGSRTNIFVEIKNKIYTPPLSVGILNGILRQKLIKENKVEEKILYIKDLKSAENIFMGNSVRGLVKVILEDISF
jgi:para-aminobenzoate synthetase / 4-amino-4-deoxychorismate lyase